MLVKILGGIDLIAAITFLILAFGAHPYTPLLFFSAGLLFVKGLFILGGDVLSLIDIASSILLLLALFFTLPIILIWIPTFLLLAKGVVSFL